MSAPAVSELVPEGNLEGTEGNLEEYLGGTEGEPEGATERAERVQRAAAMQLRGSPKAQQARRDARLELGQVVREELTTLARNLKTLADELREVAEAADAFSLAGVFTAPALSVERSLEQCIREIAEKAGLVRT